ncbi:MAG: flavocytochrome c [Bacillota bacterium]|nr:flavocytochrome c [Bacillota bacterium]
MKIVGIIGNNASFSYNRLLIEFMKKTFSDRVDFEALEIKDIPLYNNDYVKNPPEVVLEFSRKVEEADGVVIATPEYDSSVPAALKSVIEWLSSATYPFINKPVMIVGASLGMLGTSRAQSNLRQILGAPDVYAKIVPGPEILIGNAPEKFSKNGTLIDKATVNFLDTRFDAFLDFIDLQNGRKVDYAQVELQFKPGDYRTIAEGYNGRIPVNVKFSEHRIEEISVDSSDESLGISDPAFVRLPNLIVSGQTLNVDAVAGATVTSQGIIDAVAQLSKEAGANLRVLRARPKPLIKKEPDVADRVDVVIIGSGGAGLTAAARAIQEGKEVIVLEKFPAIGGNTVRTGGPMNAAHPSWQNAFSALPGEDIKLKEILDMDESEIDAEYLDDFRLLQAEIRKYFDEVEGKDQYLFDSVLWHRIQTYLGGKRTDLKGNKVYGNYKLVKQLTDNVLESIEWLESIGVEFDKETIQMPVGANWRRGHKPLKNKGFAYISALSTFIEKHGGRIMTDTKVDQLMMENGKVCGVLATGYTGNKVTIKADAVVIASGGFGANTKMLQEYNTYWTEIADDIATSNSTAITGDGILLGKEAGADLVDMGMIQMLPTCDPDTGALFTGLQVPPANFVMVNTEGRRFVDEFGSRDQLSQAAIDNGGLFYLIADDKIKLTAMNTNQEKIEKEIRNGVLFRGYTLEDLALQIGMDPKVLTETVENYNSYVDAGFDPEFNKGAFELKVEQPPFYATPRRPAVHHTMGGLRIDENARVLDKDGNPIAGLYAAGEVTGGIHGANRLGGNALADIFTFGRIAGYNAAHQK